VEVEVEVEVVEEGEEVGEEGGAEETEEVVDEEVETPEMEEDLIEITVREESGETTMPAHGSTNEDEPCSAQTIDLCCTEFLFVFN